MKRKVNKYLDEPHEFKCLTEHQFSGIDCVSPIVNWESWWQKTSLFKLATGPSLYFDLDTVIVGSLDYLVKYSQHDFAAPANWAASGHGGVQSSVMAWNGEWTEPYDKLLKCYPEASKRLWGDQEWLTEILGKDFIQIPHIGSYKYHCRMGLLPKEFRVICFHGKPKQTEANDEWILKSTSTLRYNIKSSTVNNLDQDLSGLGLNP
ncbi:MAG: hypothetical protein KJO81_03680 [Gammaproteobacteria bacterium]|nr:hypothetical protein [Gammaproteobacteria bacterium]